MTGYMVLPWRVGDHKSQVLDRDGDRVFDEPGNYEDSDFVDVTPEQVEYIVRAVNNHEALVKALADMCDEQRHDSPAYQQARKLLDSLE